MADATPIKRVLNRYLKRLQEAISRSPMLDASPSTLGRGSKLDLTHLNRFGNDTADRVVDIVLSGKHCKVHPPRATLFNDMHESDDEDTLEEQQIRVYRQIERHLIRTADKVERETGNRSLWLAYPLLFVTAPAAPDRRILAPIFLWPIRARLDESRQMCVEIGSDREADSAGMNNIMKAWIKTRCGMDLPEIDPPSTRDDLQNILKSLFEGLGHCIIDRITDAVTATPRRRDLSTDRSPCVINAGVLGVMRWQNQSIMDDLEHLLKLEDFDGVIETFATAQPVPKRPSPEFAGESDRHHVTQADYSQEKAIVEAREGPGLVIHGPPGTGKSQTITNLVADALAKGQTVLVACQKRAAIDVVANNLLGVGLRDLCHVVHDAVSDRRAVIDPLREQLDGIRMPMSTSHAESDREQLSSTIENLEHRLDSAHRELIRNRDCGLSFKSILARLIKLGATNPNLDPDHHELGPLVAHTTNAGLKELQRLANEFGRSFQSCNPPQHPWGQRKADFQLTPVTKRRILEVIQQCKDAASRHDEFCHQRGIGLCIDEPPEQFSSKAHSVLNATNTIVSDADFGSIVAFYHIVHDDEQVQNALQELLSTIGSLDAYPLDERIDRLFPVQDRAECGRTIELVRSALQYRRHFIRILSKRYRSIRKSLRPVVLRHELRWSWDELAQVETTLQGRLCRDRIDILLERFSVVDIKNDRTDEQRRHAVRKLQRWAKHCIALKKQSATFPQVADVLKSMRHADTDAVLAWQDALRTAIERASVAQSVYEALQSLHEWLSRDFVHSLFQQLGKGNSISQSLTELEDSFNTIDRLMLYERSYQQLPEDQRAVIDALVHFHLPDSMDECDLADHWCTVLEVSALTQWRQNAILESPILGTVDEDTLGQLRTQLRRDLTRKREIESDVIRQKWAEKASDCGGPHWKMLLAKTGKNAKKLREIVHRGEKHGLFTLRPCWLTNPETASQIFPLYEGLFDLVIFDEASQLPVEQSMPAIYRGKRIVVAGDEHQLPPTSFFTTSSGTVADDSADDDASEEVDADAVTSVKSLQREGIALAENAIDLLELSQCILPERYLNVHYRSRHPALIEFSNWGFYKAQLEAAHPVWGTQTPEAAPIIFQHVDGVYENKSNRTEAKHTVQLIQRIWSNFDTPPTIGVVTFNQKQEELIEEEIANAAAVDHSFRALLERERERKKGQKDVGFFVKNLESVQGDERDLIIFSTTFGPKSPGSEHTFSRTFGPLTQSGGERRLNVAVTRARTAVVVVTSMILNRISDIVNDIEPGQAIKARDYLQAYMKYAQAVSIVDVDGVRRWLNCAAKLSQQQPHNRSDHIPTFDSEFEEDVYERLVAAGWDVDTQVGENGFKIDLAVRHPDPAEGYLLGIECDGATYHSSLSARARDIWREDILNEYGWQIYRIWSTRWWVFPDEVMAELNTLLQRRLDDSFDRTEVLLRDCIDLTPTATPEHQLAKEITQDEFTVPDGESLEWARRLKEMLNDSAITEGEIASWSDHNGNLFELVIERKRATPMLVLKSRDEEYGHYSLRDAHGELIADASNRLSTVNGHDDLVDWFQWFQRALHPNAWDSD